jgi:hypothetical protein
VLFTSETLAEEEFLKEVVIIPGFWYKEVNLWVNETGAKDSRSGSNNNFLKTNFSVKWSRRLDQER